MYYFKTDISNHMFDYDGSCKWCYKDSIFKGKSLSMPCSDLLFSHEQEFYDAINKASKNIADFICTLNEVNFKYYKLSNVLYIVHEDFVYLVENDYICKYKLYPVYTKKEIDFSTAKEIISNSLLNLIS